MFEHVEMGVRPGERSRGADDAEAVVVLSADGDLRGGDGGDRAVVELGQHGEIIVEGSARDDAISSGP